MDSTLSTSEVADRLGVWVLGDTSLERGGDTLGEDKVGVRARSSRCLTVISRPAVQGRR